jgi:ATP/ADP translocase
MIRYWMFTTFYVMSELWGSVVLFVLFWGFANQVTRLHEAKRFYGLFGVGANFSGVIAGQASILCCEATDFTFFTYGNDAWDRSLFLILSMVLISGLSALALFRWLNARVLTDPRFFDPEDNAAKNKLRDKVSLKENFLSLINSRYLLSLAIIVISYNIIINLTEVLWKHQVRALYPSPQAYALYMNQVCSIIGAIATVSSLIVSANAIRIFGWTTTALLTPIILFITSAGFFSFFFFGDSWLTFTTALLHISPLTIVVFFWNAAKRHEPRR